MIPAGSNNQNKVLDCLTLPLVSSSLSVPEIS
jgi:hypothetical protein